MVRKFKMRLASVDGGADRVLRPFPDRIACARFVQMLNSEVEECHPLA